MDLSIVIVSWNVLEKLEKNLESLFASKTSFPFEVFVVDNDSSDGSAKMIKEKFPQVNLIVNQENLGFSKANNQAIKESGGEFILLLNPDMQIFPDTLEKIVFWTKENKQADVVGCSLVNKNGEKIIENNVRNFPKFLNQLAIVLKIPYVFPFIIKNYLCADFDYTKAVSVDSVRGGFFLIRKSVFARVLSEERFKRGEFLDERYFVWFEEVDFCRSVKEKGGEIWYTPVARCIDFIGASFEQIPRLKAQIYFRNSQLAYFKKWHSYWQYLLLKMAWPFGILITRFFHAIGFKSKKNT